MRSDTLLVVVQEEYLEYSTELRDYAQSFSNVLEQVNSERSILFVTLFREATKCTSEPRVPLQENPAVCAVAVPQ